VPTSGRALHFKLGVLDYAERPRRNDPPPEARGKRRR
jgi:hypothetical protein